MMKAILGLLLTSGLILFVSCDEDDGGGDGNSDLEVTSITAAGTNPETGEPVSGIDLYGATSAENVPTDAVISITFDDDIDQNDADDAITVSGDGHEPEDSVVSSENSVTVYFEEDLHPSTTYTLEIDGSLSGFLGGLLNDDVTVTFSTGGRPAVTVPQEEALQFYMDFDGELMDETGNYEVGYEEIEGYMEDRFGFAESAAHLDGNGDIIEIADSDSLLSESITISFWMLVDAADTNKVNHNFGIMGAAVERGFFIEMGGPADASWIKPTTNHVNSVGTYGTAWSDAINGGGNTNEVVTTAYEGNVSSLFDDKWTQMVITYDASTSIKTVYIDGEIVRQENFTNQDPMLEELAFNTNGVEEAIDTDFAIGYYATRDNEATEWANYEGDTRTFSGLIDDVRIWDVALSQAEVEELFQAEEAP